MDVLLKLFRRSDLGKQMVADAVKEADDQLADLAALIRGHEKTRDAAHAELDAEKRRLTPVLSKVEADLKQLEERRHELHFRLNNGIFGDRDAASRACDVACAPLRQTMKEISDFKQSLVAGPAGA
jgi:chromosome segregation ATPase